MRIPNRDFMITADGETFARNIEGKRSVWDRDTIGLGRCWMHWWRQNRQVHRAVRTVEFCALVNPLFDQTNLSGGKRFIFLGHAVVFVLRNEQLKEMAFRRAAGNDWRLFARAGLH